MTLGLRRDAEPLVGISLAGVRRARPRDLLVRFAFGAGISAAAAVVGILAGVRAGGILLAFPAILPATLTLIEIEESERTARADDVGSVMGAVGLAGFALTAWWLLPRAGAPAAIAAAAGTWLVVAVGLYLLARAVVGERSG